MHSEHLAKAFQNRMKECGWLEIEAFADHVGLSRQTITNLRRGVVRNYRDNVTVPVTTALGWTADSIELLIDGREAVEVPGWEPKARSEVSQLRDERRRLTRHVDRLSAIVGVSMDGAMRPTDTEPADAPSDQASAQSC